MDSFAIKNVQILQHARSDANWCRQMTNDDGGLGHIQTAGAGESLCVRIAVCGGRLQDQPHPLDNDAPGNDCLPRESGGRRCIIVWVNVAASVSVGYAWSSRVLGRHCFSCPSACWMVPRLNDARFGWMLSLSLYAWLKYYINLNYWLCCTCDITNKGGKGLRAENRWYVDFESSVDTSR